MEGLKTGAKKLRLLGALLVLVTLVLAYRHLDASGLLEQILDGEWLRERTLALGAWGPFLIIGLMALAIVLNPIPSAPIALVSGAVYGHTWGTLYVVIGAEIGALIAFAIARVFGHDLLRRLFGERVALGWLGSQNALTWMVLASRLLPFVSFDLVSYGAGLTPLKAWRFALATLLGLIPASFLLAHFGGEMAGANLGNALNVLLLVGLLVAVPVAIRIVRSRARRRGPGIKK
ncbi:MAG: TVP38/TMEM64 family protein [Pseudomonadota bacterium]|nr:TVP38/TMEM64 family protein [Pseudomonadota bacterium]MDP2352633.1 TVP38/TMEM64 family protein [Pseudomonadota bacterium]